MIKLQISKEAYNKKTDGIHSEIYDLIDGILKIIPQRLVELDDTLVEVKANPTILQITVDTLERFDTNQFGLIAADPKGNIIGGQYLANIPMATLEEEIPAYMSDRTYDITDEEGNVTETKVYTWSEYLTTAGGNFTVDGLVYIVASHKGKSFSFEEVKYLAGSGVIALMGNAEWKDARPEETEI